MTFAGQIYPINYIPDTPETFIDTKNVSFTVAGSSLYQGDLFIENKFILSKVTVNFVNLRVRLYLNQTFANADINRAIGSALPASHGLIYEAVFSVNSLDVLPAASAFPQGNCYLVVNNLALIQRNVSISFNYLKL